MLKCVKNLLEKLRVVKYTKSITYNLELKYFKLFEFDSPDEPGSGSKMNINFLEKLDYARHNAGVVFTFPCRDISSTPFKLFSVTFVSSCVGL